MDLDNDPVEKNASPRERAFLRRRSISILGMFVLQLIFLVIFIVQYDNNGGVWAPDDLIRNASFVILIASTVVSAFTNALQIYTFTRLMKRKCENLIPLIWLAAFGIFIALIAVIGAVLTLTWIDKLPDLPSNKKKEPQYELVALSDEEIAQRKLLAEDVQLRAEVPAVKEEQVANETVNIPSDVEPEQPPSPTK